LRKKRCERDVRCSRSDRGLRKKSDGKKKKKEKRNNNRKKK